MMGWDVALTMASMAGVIGGIFARRVYLGYRDLCRGDQTRLNRAAGPTPAA